METLFAAACSLLVAAEWAGRSVRAAWQVTGSPGHLYGLEPSASAAPVDSQSSGGFQIKSAEVDMINTAKYI